MIATITSKIVDKVSQKSPHNLKVVQAFTASFLQGGRGVLGATNPKQPEQLLKIYEMEGCPYCRRVREVLTALNLDYISYPCPKNGQKYRPEVEQLAGKAQFPFMIDPNTDTQLLESQAIIDHLFKHYSNEATTPRQWQNLAKAPIKNLANTMASVVTLTRGLRLDENAQTSTPEHLLELYSFDASPFSRIVRERLCELEIAHIVRNVARDTWKDMADILMGQYQPLAGSKRAGIRDEVMSGKILVPFLVDANTGTQMFESKDIVAYLNRQYA